MAFVRVSLVTEQRGAVTASGVDDVVDGFGRAGEVHPELHERLVGILAKRVPGLREVYVFDVRCDECLRERLLREAFLARERNGANVDQAIDLVRVELGEQLVEGAAFITDREEHEVM